MIPAILRVAKVRLCDSLRRALVPPLVAAFANSGNVFCACALDIILACPLSALDLASVKSMFCACAYLQCLLFKTADKCKTSMNVLTSLYIY